MPELSLRSDAGASLADLVAGPDGAGRVLGAFPTAVYVATEEDRVVAIEAADGVGLPNALRLHRPAAGLDLAAVPRESTATVGGGRLRVRGLVVTVDRWEDHTYRPAGVDVVLLRQRLDQLDAALEEIEPFAPPLATRIRALEAAVAEGTPDDAGAAGRDLVGLGDGLTPSGDDVLCGLLGAGRTLATALGTTDLDAALRHLGDAVCSDAAERTTALSATLLRHAARAELARPARALLRALLGRTPVAPAVHALLSVGHTSGRDLALGSSIGIHAALAAASVPTLQGAR